MSWRPAQPPRLLVELGLGKLSLADQVRYREEVWAELHELPRLRQVTAALSFWSGSRALQRACDGTARESFWMPRKDVRCLLHVHHMVRVHDRQTPHGYYRECSRCGKFFDIPYIAPIG